MNEINLKVKKIIDEILSLKNPTTADCRQLYEAVRATEQVARADASAKALKNLRVGLKVGFGDKTRFGRRSWKEGVIARINRTKALVKVGSVEWTVPFDMVEVLDQRKKLQEPMDPNIEREIEAEARAEARCS